MKHRQLRLREKLSRLSIFDKPWIEVLAVTSALLLLTALIAWSGVDIAVSSRFAQGGSWPVGERFPWKLLYRMDRIPALTLASTGLLAILWGMLKPSRRHWIRPGFFLVLLLAFGPGLLVNAVFKDHWGRPRPREVIEFGGEKQFLQPWQKGVAGQGRSFPSGHTSAAFYTFAPFFILRRNRPGQARAWLFGGLLFGVLMTIARTTQGGHFLSDNLWSLGIVYLSSLALASLLKPDLPAAHQGERGSYLVPNILSPASPSPGSM